MKVVRVTRSPLNAKRWSLDLSCGHEVWVTSNRRPTRENEKCSQGCEAETPKEIQGTPKGER